MLINKCASKFLFLKIKVRRGKKWRIVFPIPLYIITQLIAGIQDLSIILGLIIQPFYKIQKELPLSFSTWKEFLTYFSLCWDELRNYGSWKMLEIDSSDIFISIEFY